MPRAAKHLLQPLRASRKAGVWDRLLGAVSEAYDGGIVMIDPTCVRVQKHTASEKRD
jgi:hypothetical protein